jgi:hypothetical protein
MLISLKIQTVISIEKLISIYIPITTGTGGNVKSEADHNMFGIRGFLITPIKRTGVKLMAHNFRLWPKREWYNW